MQVYLTAINTVCDIQVHLPELMPMKVLIAMFCTFLINSCLCSAEIFLSGIIFSLCMTLHWDVYTVIPAHVKGV